MRIPGRRELLLLAASTLLSLLALELLIRAGLVPLPTHVVSDGWYRETWLRRQHGVKLTNLRIDGHDPMLGWTLVPNLHGVHSAGAFIHSNSAGMRGTREYSLERSDRFRVVALGDSFTFGECVEDDESFVARLEQRIAPGEVLNLGVHGYGHDQMLLRLRSQGLAYRPDLVLLGFYGPDIERSGLRFRDYAKPHFRLDGAELVLEDVPVPSPEEYVHSFRLRVASYAEMGWDVLWRKHYERRTRRLAEAILRSMATEVRASGAKLALVYLPSQNQARAGKSWPSRVYQHLCAERDVLCIDPTARIHEFLKGEPDPASHFKCHYTPAVYGLVADEIAAALEPLLPAAR